MLNTRSVFDPRFSEAFARTGQAAMTSSVLVRRRKPEGAAGAAEWDYSLGKYRGSDFVTLWAGQARVQPNKDWRAKSYEFANMTTAMQACRFSLPLMDGVWNGALAEEQRHFEDEDQIIIVENFFPGLDAIKRFTFIVRNDLISGNAGLQNILADVDLKGGISRDHS